MIVFCLIGLIASAIFTGIGAIPVIGLGLALRRWILRRASLPVALAVSHALIVIVSIALYRVDIFWAGPPVDDVYVPFAFVPGFPVHLLGYMLGGWVDHAFRSDLLTMMSFNTFSILTLVIIPGVVCLLLGTLQWYLLGRLWLRLRPKIDLSQWPWPFNWNHVPPLPPL